MNKIAVGIDIGGTNSVIGLVKSNGEIVNHASIKTQKHGLNFDSYLKELSETIKILVSSSNFDLLGIGIGAPNGNFHTGNIEFAPNLKWEGKIALCKELQKYFPKLPIKLTNDANAAALGEKLFGKGKNIDDFVTITLGTGVGSGFIVNGNLMYGHDGMAGEIGHTVVYPKGRSCGCGQHGCLETYVSASGIVRTATELLSIHQCESVLAQIPFSQLDSKTIAELANKGDWLAQEVFKISGQILGTKLADIVAITSPQAIFITGGVINADELLLAPIREHLEKNLMEVYKGKIRVEKSGLPGTNSAIIGASSLIWNIIKR